MLPHAIEAAAFETGIPKHIATRTLLDKLTNLFLGTPAISEAPPILVADAYYANRKVVLPLVEARHHLVTRARKNTVAWHVPTSPAKPKRGRPKLYGDKVELWDLLKDKEAFVAASSPVYGEQGVSLSYHCVNPLWRSIGALVRFVLVDYPTGGQIILMDTDIHRIGSRFSSCMDIASRLRSVSSRHSAHLVPMGITSGCPP
ncbi:MAG: transposase [bacterium]|nr:transposase [bacterium]